MLTFIESFKLHWAKQVNVSNFSALRTLIMQVYAVSWPSQSAQHESLSLRSSEELFPTVFVACLTQLLSPVEIFFPIREVWMICFCLNQIFEYYLRFSQSFDLYKSSFINFLLEEGSLHNLNWLPNSNNFSRRLVFPSKLTLERPASCSCNRAPKDLRGF